MIQETSKQSYYDLIKSDKLGELQKRVLDTIVYLRTCTDKEISEVSYIPINVVTARRNELMHEGIIEEDEKRKCKITNRMAISWKFKEAVNTQSKLKTETKGLSSGLFNRLLKELSKCNSKQENEIIRKLVAVRIKDIRFRLEGLLFENNYEKDLLRLFMNLITELRNIEDTEKEE